MRKIFSNYYKAVLLFKNSAYPDALLYFKKQLQHTPAHNPTFYYLGRIYLLLKQYELAEHFFQICQQKNRMKYKVNYYRGRALLGLKDYSSALYYFSQSAKQYPFINFFIALIHYNENRFIESHNYLLKCPESLMKKSKVKLVLSAVFFNLGNEHYNQQNYQSAEEFFLASIDINPHAYPSYFQLGSLLIEKKSYHKAKVYFEKLHNIFPRNEPLNLSLAYLYHKTDDLAKLENHLKKFGIEIQSWGHEGFKKILAFTLYKNKKYKEAIPLFLQLYQRKHYDEQLLFCLAQSRLATGHLKKAFNCYQKIFQISIQHTTINNAYLLLLINHKMYDRCYSIAQNFIQQYVGNSKTDLYYFYSAINAGKPIQFHKMFEKLLKTFSDHPMFVEATAIYHMKKRNIDKSVQYYYKLYQLIPDDQYTLNELVDLFLKRKLYHQALYYLKKIYHLRPDDITVVYYYSYFLLKQGFAKEAIDILDKCPEKNDQTYFLVSEAYLKLKDQRKSFHFLKKSFLLNPLYLPAQYKSMNIFYKKNKYYSAYKIAKLMEKTHPQFKRSKIYQTIILAKMYKFDKAIHTLQFFLKKIAPDHPYFTYLLAGLHYYEGNTNECKKIVDELIEKRGKQPNYLVLLCLCAKRNFQLAAQKKIIHYLTKKHHSSPSFQEYQIRYLQPGNNHFIRKDLGIRLP
ncbi:MAG: tetratricopeptide repeat protein [Spirochaetes bacterium]|nr:tetratricopeptide repeat protein [Spirochaetota bacterium]